MNVSNDVRGLSGEGPHHTPSLIVHGGPFGDASGHRLVDEELPVHVVVPEGDGKVFAIHGGRLGRMV